MRRIENRTQAMQFLETHGAELDRRAEREQGYIIPSVTEVTQRGEREWHIFLSLIHISEPTRPY